jgi:translocation protein SEC62
MSIPNVQLGVPQGALTAGGGGIGAGQIDPAAIQAAINRMKPIAISAANYTRDNKTLKNRKGLLNNTEDVEFFRYKRLVRALASDDYKQQQQNPANRLVPIQTAKQAEEVVKMMIQTQLIIPVTKLHFNEIKQTNRKWKPVRDKPTLVKAQRLELSPDSYFVWNFTKQSPFMILYGILLIVGIFTVILFPLWPRKMKSGVYYLSMGALGLLGVFFAIAIVRFILYVFMLIIGKPFWLFPNLFADVGVIESFIPLYEWEKPKKKKSTKKSKSGVELKEVD